MNRNTKEVRTYLALTFAITWVCWGAIALANLFGGLVYGAPLTMLLFLVGGNAPPIAAYLLQKKWGEISGLKAFLGRYLKPSATLKHYGLMLAFLGIHFGLAIALGSTNRVVPVYYGLLMFPVNFVGGALEEIGWRGILQPRLERLMTPIKATLIVAAVWWVWHLPLWFIKGTYQSDISFFYFGVSVLGFSFLLAALRKRTGSVFMCILLHGLLNSFWGVFLLDQNITTVIIAGAEILVGVWLLVRAGRSEDRKGLETVPVLEAVE